MLRKYEKNMSFLLRLRISVTRLTPAAAQKNTSQPPCQSTADFTSELFKRLLVGLWKAFKMTSHRRSSSHKVSWSSWWARDCWTLFAGRPIVEGPAKASCARAATCALSSSSWPWPPRRPLCTTQKSRPCWKSKTLLRN